MERHILSALEDILRFGISKPDERPEDAAGGTKTSSAGGSG